MMSYREKLVCAVKVNNRILREKTHNNESTVFIPFGSEYSLLLKNLGGRTAVVNVEIDGRKVSDGGFYIRAGQTHDIERFVESLSEGRRFKFIEKTEEISNYRGDKIDDGIIRVTWQFEKAKPEVKETLHVHSYPYHTHYWGCRCGFCNPWIGNYPSGSSFIASSTFTKCADDCTYTASNSGLNYVPNAPGMNIGMGIDSAVNCNVADAPGITVEGYKSYQQFGTVYADELELNIHSMVILLRGINKNNTYVHQPLLVDMKVRCTCCGRAHSSKFEFCPNCGAALRK